MPHNKKIFALVIFGILIAALAIFLPEQEDIAFEYIVNNTDLYNNGRIPGTTYTANDSAIQLFLIFHVIGTGASLVVDTNLSINGTVVEDRDYRTTAGAGIHEHFSMTAHIPKGANYSVTNSSNLETIEWREYPILSGRNGTLSLNITQAGGTGSQNLSQVLSQGNTAENQYINFTNTGKWLKIGYNSFFNLMEINTSQTMYFTQNGQFVGFMGNGFAYSAYNDKPMQFGQSGTNYSNIRYNTTYGTTWMGAGTASKNLNITGFNKVNMYQELDMNNNALTNCSNCGGNQNLSQVLGVGEEGGRFNITNITDVNMKGKFYLTPENFTIFAPSVSTFELERNDLVIMRAVSPNNIFGAVGFTNNLSSPGAPTDGQTLFNFAASGYSGASWVGGRASIIFRTKGNWNTTSQGTQLEFFTTPNSSTTLTQQLLINDTGKIFMNNLRGDDNTGNAYLCINKATNEVYIGNPGC